MKKLTLEDIVIFENENYLVVNKPPFFATLDDKGRAETIQNLITPFPDYQIAHRLDKETSGALVIAKSAEAYRHIAIQFEKRTVEKIYFAVTEGVHDIDGLEVNAPLRVGARGYVKIDFREGKPSTTLFKTEKAYRNYTLIKCKPLSGRTHQIRVHLSHLGAPIANDTMYGGNPVMLSSLKRNFNLKKGTEELSLIKRFALHAKSIAFQDLNDEPLSIEADYPKDFAVLLKQLDKLNS